MDDPKKLAKSALDYTLANSSSEALKSYIERGRQLAQTSDDELLSLYRQAFIDWSGNMFDDQLSQRSLDAQSELELRGIELPSDGMEAALANVKKDLRSLIQGTDASAFTALIDAYRDASAKKQ